MSHSDSIGKLIEALSKAQGAMTSAPQDAKGNFGKYATLASLWQTARKPLTDNGLAVVQTTETDETGTVWLTTVLAHVSGEWISGTLPVRPVQGTPQGMGSALTYARRYGMSALIGMSADDDDDGTEGSAHKQTRQPTPKESADRMAAAGRPLPEPPPADDDNGFDSIPTATQERASTPAAKIIARIRGAAGKFPQVPVGEEGEKAVTRARANVANLVGRGNKTAAHHLIKVLFDKTSSSDLTMGECNILSGWIGSRKEGDTWMPRQEALDEYKLLIAEHPLPEGVA